MSPACCNRKCDAFALLLRTELERDILYRESTRSLAAAPLAASSCAPMERIRPSGANFLNML
jgi:hypothetical protein